MNIRFAFFALAIGTMTAAAVAFAGCTFTTTVSKPPVYGEPLDSLRAQLRQLVTCEHFDVEGREITRNGGKREEIDITIVNGQGIPEGDGKWELGRALAGVVKRALKDTLEYHIYVVGFSTERKDGMSVSKTTTSRQFMSREL